MPVQAVEIVFHGTAAIALAVAAKRRLWPPQRLPAYLTIYAALRFALEFWRQHPTVAFGITWHQWLAICLFATTATAWWERRRLTAS